MVNLTPQPVWINGKLVAPKGWISPETREAIRKATEGCQVDPDQPSPPTAPVPHVARKEDPWAPETLGEMR